MNSESVFARPARPPTRSLVLRRRAARRAGVVSVGVVSLIATALPATASITGPAAQAGRAVTVFHNKDIVNVSGFAVNEVVTVRVLRNGVTIGTATGPASSLRVPPGAAPDFGLEVNVGPPGVPQPGECWDGTTPDIRPGDRVVVSSASSTLVDERTVDGLQFTSPPVADVNGNVLISGTAVLANGTAVLPSALALDFRVPKLFRDAPEAVTATPDVFGGFTARYDPAQVTRFDGGPQPVEVVRANLLGDGHGLTLADVAGLDTQTVDGLVDQPTVGPGCETVAPVATDAVTATTPASVNIAAASAASLVVSGSAVNANAVRVTVDDDDPVTPAVTALATLLPAAATTATTTVKMATMTQSWTAPVPMAGVLGLKDGPLTVSAVFDRVSEAGNTPAFIRTITTITGRPLVVTKDMIAPNMPEASPPAGSYPNTQSVMLSATGCVPNVVRYTLGSATGPGPTAISPIVTGQILITASQTLRAIAFDSVGNPSPMLTASYVIGAPAVTTSPPVTTPPADTTLPPVTTPPVVTTLPSVTTQASGTQAASGLAGGVPTAQGSGQAALIPPAGTTITGVTPRAGVGRATVPGTTSFRLSSGVRSVIASWAPPASDGGAAITAYRFSVLDQAGRLVKSGSAPGAARSMVLGGLRNATTYRVRMVAANAVGSGPLSALSAPVRTPNVASAPGMRSAAAGSTRDRLVSAAVTWTAPRSNGGRPVTGYRVVATRSDGRSVTVTTGPAARSLQVPGLTRGRTYTFRVLALNAVGASAGSARSKGVVAR